MEQQNLDNKIQQEHTEQEIDLVELGAMLMRHWLWYAVAIALALVLGFLYIKSTPKTYERHASVLIKDDKASGGANMQGMAALSDLADFGLKSSVDNEILIFKSNSLLREVSTRLSLNTTYSVRQGLRKKDLYGNNPFEVVFLEASTEQPIQLKGELKENQVQFTDVKTWTGGEEVELPHFSVQLNDTVDSPLGLLLVKTTGLGKAYEGETIQIHHRGLKNVTLGYGNAIQIALAEKNATIINLSLRDEVPQRAEDILNTLIDVYCKYSA